LDSKKTNLSFSRRIAVEKNNLLARNGVKKFEEKNRKNGKV
jgi:hypothetical protein